MFIILPTPQTLTMSFTAAIKNKDGVVQFSVPLVETPVEEGEFKLNIGFMKWLLNGTVDESVLRFFEEGTVALVNHLGERIDKDTVFFGPAQAANPMTGKLRELGYKRSFVLYSGNEAPSSEDFVVGEYSAITTAPGSTKKIWIERDVLASINPEDTIVFADSILTSGGTLVGVKNLLEKVGLTVSFAAMIFVEGNVYTKTCPISRAKDVGFDVNVFACYMYPEYLRKDDEINVVDYSEVAESERLVEFFDAEELVVEVSSGVHPTRVELDETHEALRDLSNEF